jgi:spermidine/putrescine transport system permease protein
LKNLPYKRKKKNGLFGVIYLCLIYLFLFLPIITIAVNSFNANTKKPYITFTGFSFTWYEKLMTNRALLESFQNTLIVAFSATILSVIIGTLAAVGMYKFKFRGKAMLDGLLYIPVVIPEIVLGISLLSLFANTGIPRGYLTLILSHASFSIPFVVFNVRARLGEYDNSIEEASMDLGANRFQTFIKITLPMLLPGIMSGALLAFTLSIDDVIISYFNNGQVKTLPLKVMESVKSGVAPDVDALSTLILLGTAILVFVSQAGELRKQKKYQ